MKHSVLLSALLIILSAPINLFSQSVPILFEVNMSYQIDQEQFDPETEFVDVAGTFNNWGGDLTQLSDEDGDSTYSATVNGFSSGQTIEFKFRINGQWNGREEFPGTGNNRSYNVKPNNNEISVWYNDEADPDAPPEASFSVSATSVFTNSLVQFDNQSVGNITTWEWTFEGGAPGSSNEENPAVRYTEPGTYDVQLIAANESTGDTLTATDYITVNDREIGETRWWNETVFYEIFVRSFYDSDGDGIGDFNGLTQKLDYLNDGDPNTDTDLGVTGIWLMPIHESPTYHGYDAIDYRSINPDYGTMDDFKAFLDAAHDRGIKVIIDYVMNHTSTEHPWFQKSAAGDPEYRDFYRWSDTNPGYSGPWGQTVWHNFHNGQGYAEYYYGVFWSGMPDLNYENPAVRDSMFAISDFWINEVGVDGFRQDAVIYIDEDGSTLKNTDETLQFWQDFNANLKAANPDAFAVGEAWEPTDIALQYVNDSRLDYVFEFDLANAILNGVNGGSADPILSHMQTVYNEYPFLGYGTFLTNHDQNRVMNVLGEDVGKAKAAASVYLTLPGIPYLYYGEEVGMLGQKPDENIRLPMQWSSEPNAGFTSGSPWRTPNSNFAQFNVEVMETDENSLFNHYRDLIQFRNDTPALQTGEYEAGLTSEDGLLTFLRGKPDGGHYLVAINLTSEVIDNASADFSNYFFNYGSSTAGWNGEIVFGDAEEEGFTAHVTGSGQGQPIENMSLAPYSVKIVSFESLATSTEGEGDKPQEFKLHQNYPNPFNPTTTLSFYLPDAANVSLSVFDVTGRKVAILVDRPMNAGSHTQTFDASALSSGIYFYRLEAGEFQSVQKMMLVK